MRTLLRTRKQLVRERSRHIQRLQKTLEDANIKLDSVISDILGLSGRRMIEALIAGETDPNALPALAHRRIKASPAELEAALRGRVTRHHRFLLGLHLQQIDAIDAAIDQIDPEVDALVEPFRTAVQLLTTIPGIDELSACVILAEIGHDMSRFPTAGHLISWAGLCPKNDESAGKRRPPGCAKERHGSKTTLVQCAWAAARKKASYLQAQFHRLRSRRLGKKGDWCCRRFDPDGCLSHVEEWNPLRGPWPPSLRQTGSRQASPPPHQSPTEPRICRSNHPCGGRRLMTVRTLQPP
jgi:transposase